MNVGDSRAIMCNVEGGEISAREISNDHKPFHPVEKERIEKAGGEIMPKEGTTGPLRVWKRDEESPGLAVTRTLGDLLGHSIGVSAEPDIEYWKVMADDYFIIIASDGIWDVMNSAEVVGFMIKETEDMKKGVVQLVSTARSIWEYQNFLRNQQRSKNMFGKAIPFRSN